MHYRCQIAVAIVLSTLFFLSAIDASAQDWSLKQMNPFGKKATSRTETQQEGSTRWVPKFDVNRLDSPITATGIKNSFTRFGQRTSAVFSQTKQALTPKVRLPKLRMPTFRDPQERPTRTAKQPPPNNSGALALVSWIMPKTNSKK